MELSAPIYLLKHKAKLIARREQIPLHHALNRLARLEGYQSWSHLSASSNVTNRAQSIFKRLTPGNVVLLGARPGQGKTKFGLELAILAAQSDFQSYFLTLEYNVEDVLARLNALDIDQKSLNSNFIVDSSDEICADYILRTLPADLSNPFVVVDYLQLLDQRRTNATLNEQLGCLRKLSEQSRAIVVLISQIDRSFEHKSKAIPTLEDVRMPNPMNLDAFTHSCFLHNGNIKFEPIPVN